MGSLSRPGFWGEREDESDVGARVIFRHFYPTRPQPFSTFEDPSPLDQPLLSDIPSFLGQAFAVEGEHWREPIACRERHRELSGRSTTDEHSRSGIDRHIRRKTFRHR